MKKIAVAGTGYVGLSIATLLSQRNQVTAVDVIKEKVDMVNRRQSPIVDRELEEYLTTKDLNLRATLDAEEAYRAQAGAYQTQIEALAKTYTDAVNAIAMTTFTTEKGNAETKYNTAVSDIESTLHISNKDAKNAVKDIEK